MTKYTDQQIADLYSAAVSAEVNDEAGDAASESRYELFDQLEATGGMAHTIRVLIDRVRAAERAMNPETAADDIAWWKAEAEDCKARLLELSKENEDLRRSLAQHESAPAPDSRHSAAVATLESSGYTYHGGQFWKPPLGKAPAYITGEQPKSELLQRAEKLAETTRELADQFNDPASIVYALSMPADLHPDSQQLVLDTARAMAQKLLKAQVKYGFDNGWKVPPVSASGDDGRHFWSREECLAAFFHHLAKGDPLDCINYLAFMRANGWATELPPQQEQQPAAEIITAGIGGYGCEALVAGLPIGTKLYSVPQSEHLPVALPRLTHCAAGRDGECNHSQCPQLRDDEPKKSGRHCPLDTHEDDE